MGSNRACDYKSSCVLSFLPRLGYTLFTLVLSKCGKSFNELFFPPSNLNAHKHFYPHFKTGNISENNVPKKEKKIVIVFVKKKKLKNTLFDLNSKICKGDVIQNLESLPKNCVRFIN